MKTQKKNCAPLVEDNPWYNQCVRTTLENIAGIIPGGCVSVSGAGDGCYEAYIARDKEGRVVEVAIIFF